MEKSEKIDALAKALKEFQKDAPNVTKDAKANYGKYATLGNVIETVREGLAAQGLSFAQFPDGEGLTTILMHESGQWISATGLMKLDKQTAQGLGSAITYSRRYGLSAMLGLATDDDDDGAVASKPAVAAKPVPPAKVADKRDALKARIKELVDGMVLVPLTTGGEYKDYVREASGYELVPENFEAIVDTLIAKQNHDGE